MKNNMKNLSKKFNYKKNEYNAKLDNYAKKFLKLINNQ